MHPRFRSKSWSFKRGKVIAILFPIRALYAFTMVFAAFAAIDGILSIIAALRGARNREDRWPFLVLRGLVGIAAAVLFVIAPFAFTIGYALATLGVLSAWAIATGAFEILSAIRLRKEIRNEWLLGLSGLLSILLGLALPVLLYFNPALTMLSAAWAIATWALLAGAILIGLGWRLRRSPSEVQAEQPAR